jgi:hypothetical protein
MSPLSIVLLIAGILAAHAMVLIPLVSWARRKARETLAGLQRELDSTRERVILSPAPAVYRGASSGSPYPKAKGNSVAALTERRLVIRRLVGKGIEIPVSEIVGVRDDKWFLRAYAGGQPHVIVKLSSGAEVGLFVDQHEAWTESLRRLASARAGTSARH